MAEVEAVQIIAESLKQQVRGSPRRRSVCPTFLQCTFLHSHPRRKCGKIFSKSRGRWSWREQWSGLLSKGTCLLCKVQKHLLAVVVGSGSPITPVHKSRYGFDKDRVPKVWYHDLNTLVLAAAIIAGGQIKINKTLTGFRANHLRTCLHIG